MKDKSNSINPNSGVSVSPDVTFRISPKNALGKALTLMAVLTMAASAYAQQSVVLRANPTRLTIPVNGASSVNSTITVTIEDGTTPVNLAITGLPPGATASLDTTSFNVEGDSVASFTLDYNNVAQGEYDLAIEASGGASYRLPIPLIASYEWDGEAGTDWTGAANWVGNISPNATDNVVFSDLGSSTAQSNITASISSDTEVASLRFKNDDWQHLEIQSGATLSVTGDGGLSLLQDTLNTGGSIPVAFSGAGALVVSNQNANIALLKEAGAQSILDMDQLNTFVADVNRLGLGDYRLYPNYTTNGYDSGGTGEGSRPARFFPFVSLAKTNFIRAIGVDANNYSDPEVRDYSFTISNSEEQGLGSGSQFLLQFGATNVFLMDSIVFGGSTAKAENDNRIIFNADTNTIPTNVVPVAYFRNSDGASRMSVFTVADASGTGGSGSGTKVTVNFSGGKVDALVDRLYLGRDRLESQDNDTAQAELTIADGVFDVNTAIISYQEQGNNAIPPDEQGNDPSGEVYGTLNVSDTAVFIVNDTLELGHTTADPGDIRQAESGNGQIDISDGGTVMANNITVGGVTKVSGNNRISISDGGNLVLSNNLASPDKKLTTLSMSDAKITLHVDASRTDPYIYVTNLVTSGTANEIVVPATAGTFGSFPAQVPLISYEGDASANFVLIPPQGLFGFVVNNTANGTIDAVFTEDPPQNLKWDGVSSTTWGTSGEPAWKDGLTFLNGDSVTFDDTAAGSASVTVNGSVLPAGSGVVVSNSTKNYSFNGGSIEGTALMRKEGTGSLAINSTSQLALNLNEGTVTGSGSIGATTVGTNGTLNYSGTINRLISSGTATSSGAIVNGATIQSAGTFTNLGQINGPVTVTGSNTFMFVAPGAGVGTDARSRIGANSTLFLSGNWTNGYPGGPTDVRLEVAGTLMGEGLVRDADRGAATSLIDGRLVIASGGTLSPGDEPGHIATFITQSRLDFTAGSRIIIELDLTSGTTTHDIIGPDVWSTMQGTIVMTNIGGGSFAPGQSFQVFKRTGTGSGNNTQIDNDNHLPTILPSSPGLGMAWDLSRFRTNGWIDIVAIATEPVDLDFEIVSGTNATFSWPASHTGWELLTQTRALTNGMSLARTNWSVVAGSRATNQITITNWLGDEDDRDPRIQLYRLAHPRFE